MTIRAPRSGRINIPSPDVVAVKDGRIIIIECKSHAKAFKVDAEQLQQLREWEEKGKATAYVGWKISRKGWRFLTLGDVVRNNGNVGKNFIAERGIGIDSL